MTTRSGSYRFPALIVCATQALGTLTLALDTAASMSAIKLTSLVHLGFDPARPHRQVQMTTGSATGTLPVFALTRFSAVGHHQFGFSVIGHTLPSGSESMAYSAWISDETRS